MTRRFLFSTGVAGQSAAPETPIHSSNIAALDASYPKLLLLGTMGCHLCEKAYGELSIALQRYAQVQYFDIAECQHPQDANVLIDVLGQEIPLIVFSQTPKDTDGLKKLDGVASSILAHNTSIAVEDDTLFKMPAIWHETLLDEILKKLSSVEA